MFWISFCRISANLQSCHEPYLSDLSLSLNKKAVFDGVVSVIILIFKVYTGVSRKKNSKKNVRFNKIENSKKNMVSPHREKLSKDMINKKDLIHRIRKGVLSPGKMGIFQTRYKSPQIKDINYITMPNFKVDRGRRKISKMGGLQTMFQFDNSNQGSSTRVPQNLHLNRTLNKQRDTRRLTNFGPSPTRKMVINHPILKKQTMNTELLNNLDNERNPHSNPNTFFEVIPEESQNQKPAKKSKH